jgi:uncharacterized SAM-binding protein YcdF (DUF218 family)
MIVARHRRPWRLLLRIAAVLAAAVLVAFLAFLPFAGRYLVHEDPLDRADVAFALAGSNAERWLEAAELYREGFVPRIVVSRGPVEDAEVRLESLGVHYPTSAELAKAAMIQLRIPEAAVTLVKDPCDNTAQEARALHAMASRAGWQRIIIVTSKYHTRRTSFAFNREFRDTPIRLLIRGSRYDQSKPERWWGDRRDIRWITSELPKLALYRLGLGG